MKVLIVVSCILAAVSAGYVGQSVYGYAPLAYHAGHVPVLDHNGYQLDTPEVAHAKAAHFAAHAEANARGHGLYSSYAGPLAYAGHYTSHYAGPQHIPVIGPNGVPLETPEVVAAKINHAVAHAEAKARNGDLHHIAPLAYSHGVAAHGLIATPYAVGHAYTGPQHIPIIGANGVPLETPEVVAAKISHAAAHVEAKARNGDLHHIAPLAYSHGIAAHGLIATPYAVGHSYAGPQHIPIIGANGVPLDTPEVAAGKVANAVAHAEAHARNGDHAIVAPLAYSHGVVAHGLVAPVAAHHVPLIGHNGVPLDTPEVAVAKAHHAAAHIEAQARNLVHHY